MFPPGHKRASSEPYGARLKNREREPAPDRAAPQPVQRLCRNSSVQTPALPVADEIWAVAEPEPAAAAAHPVSGDEPADAPVYDAPRAPVRSSGRRPIARPLVAEQGGQQRILDTLRAADERGPHEREQHAPPAHTPAPPHKAGKAYSSQPRHSRSARPQASTPIVRDKANEAVADCA